MRAFDTPITTNDQSIDRVLNAGLPVAFIFLDGPAPAALDEMMNQLARENVGQLLIAKIQAKENPQSTGRYTLTRMPAVVTLKNGQVQSKAEGLTALVMQKHILFLLGKGPKPETQPQPAAPSRTQATPSGDGHPRTVTDATFDQEVLHASNPVLVDFWAPWCGPCRMTEPIVERLAQELSGRLKVAKINVDENPMIAQRYGVQSIPTMMVVKDGKIVDRWVGALPEQNVRMRIAPVIAR